MELGHIGVCASIRRSYLELEAAAADRAVGVNEWDTSAVVARMMPEVVDEVARKVGLLLLVVEVEEVVVEDELLLLLCSILPVTLVTINVALQDNKR